MELLNTWLREIQYNGRGIELYGSLGFVCTILMWSALLFYTLRQRINPLKTIPVMYIVYYFLVYAQHLMTWYRRDFDLTGYLGTSNVGYAFVLLPLVCWLCDKAFNLTDGTSGELAAVTTLAWHFFGRSVCTFSGCCHGIPCRWGIYTHYLDKNAFPVCWLESLFTLGILIFLVVRILRRDLLPEDGKPRPRLLAWFYSKRRQPDNGKALPYMLLFYGIGRFFSEFLRYHPEEDILFGFLPEFSIHALLMVLVGGLLLYRKVKKEKAASVEEPSLPELRATRR